MEVPLPRYKQRFGEGSVLRAPHGSSLPSFPSTLHACSNSNNQINTLLPLSVCVCVRARAHTSENCFIWQALGAEKPDQDLVQQVLCHQHAVRADGHPGHCSVQGPGPRLTVTCNTIPIPKTSILDHGSGTTRIGRRTVAGTPFRAR